jgi:hypothetical protein
MDMASQSCVISRIFFSPNTFENMNLSSEGNTVSVYEAMENFKIFNVKESPSTCAVVNGGWIIYSLPSYKGASLIHFEGGQKMNSTFG